MPVAKNPNVLANSRDRRLLMATAVEFAGSPSPNELELLLMYLSQEEFLDRLDAEDDYLGPPKQLRLARVLKTLMDNPSGFAHETLVSLTSRNPYRTFEPCEELLIRALAAVRPAPGPAVAYWDERSQPDDPFLHVTIDALADNGTLPALSLFVRKMYDPEIEEEYKLAWIRGPVLRHRNDETMLQVCSIMLRRGLPADFDTRLVEALFDYKRNWYLSCSPPTPPPRLEMTPPARHLLRLIGQHALDQVPLDAEQRIAVETGLSQIGTE